MSVQSLTAPLRESWSTSVKGRRLVATDSELLLAEGPREVNVALSARSGKRLWTYPWGTAWPGPGDTVLVALSEDEVHVVDAATGRPRRVLWCGWPRGYAGDLVIGQLSCFHAVYACGVDWESGRRLWRAPSPAAIHETAISGDTLVAGLHNGSVLALDLRTGRERWRREWPQWFDLQDDRGRAHVLILGDDVIVGVPGHTLRLSLATGATAWHAERQFEVLHADRLYGCQGAEYFALDAATGREALRRTLDDIPEREGESFRCHAVSDTHAFLTSDRDALLALERDSGLPVWSHQDPGEPDVVACFARDGRLYYRVETKVYCFESGDAR